MSKPPTEAFKEKQRVEARFRRGLLERATPAEQAFARILDAHAIPYRRQRGIIRQGVFYIVDFWLKRPWYCWVEIDGPIHDTPAVRRQDAKKTAYLTGANGLRKRGGRLLRFTNAEVLNHPEQVKQRLDDYIATRPAGRDQGLTLF